jgi:thioredoxin
MKNLGLILFSLLLMTSFGCNNLKGNQGQDNIEVADNKNESKTELSEASAKPEYLTYDTFIEKVWDFESNPQEWVYKGDVPCVIDFYADWCKPCKMIAPIMDDLASEYDGKVKIYKIDTEKERKLAQVFQIRSIPAVLFSPVEGRPMMQTGALPKDQYIKIIEDELLKSE